MLVLVYIDTGAVPIKLEYANGHVPGQCPEPYFAIPNRLFGVFALRNIHADAHHPLGLAGMRVVKDTAFRFHPIPLPALPSRTIFHYVLLSAFDRPAYLL